MTVSSTLSGLLLFAIAGFSVTGNRVLADSHSGTNEAAMALLDMDLEALAQVPVYTVGRKVQRLDETPAAVFVITSEDIARSGARTITDLLRMVPGVQVGRAGTSSWAVGVRGFKSVGANSKLLVLIDGRSAYSMVSGTMHWDAVRVPLEDIERIEVVRGPGATTWGPNAVNGVISIVTKHASKTQDGYVTAGVGTEERWFGEGHYGTAMSDRSWLRVWGSAFERDGLESTSDAVPPPSDWWRGVAAGLRIDADASDSDELMFTLAVDAGLEELPYPSYALTPPYTTLTPQDRDSFSYQAVGRWRHVVDPEESDVVVQVSFDHSDVESPVFYKSSDVLQAEARHRFPLGKHQDIVWGAGYRWIHDDSTPGASTHRLDPASDTYDVITLFLQDDVALVGDSLHLVGGIKLEHNDFSGTDFQPTVRLIQRIGAASHLWASVTRAVRTPERLEQDGQRVLGVSPPGGLAEDVPTEIVLNGSQEFDTESLLAYEIGYRSLWRRTILVDLATFYYDYDELRYYHPVPPSGSADPVPHAVAGKELDNSLEGTSWGAEVAASVRPRAWMRLSLAYTFYDESFEAPGDPDLTIGDIGNNANHLVSLRTLMDLSRNVQCDVWLRYVSDQPYRDVDAYFTGDIRLAYSPRPFLSLAVVGQNLFEDSHREHIENALERGVYGQLSLRF